jgi:hypothetical protein
LTHDYRVRSINENLLVFKSLSLGEGVHLQKQQKPPTKIPLFNGHFITQLVFFGEIGL